MDKYSRIKFIVDENSPKELVEMFARAAASARSNPKTQKRAWCNATVQVRETQQ